MEIACIYATEDHQPHVDVGPWNVPSSTEELKF